MSKEQSYISICIVIIHKRCNHLPSNLVLKILLRSTDDNYFRQHCLWSEDYARD